MKCSVQAYRAFDLEWSRLCFTICTLGHPCIRRLHRATTVWIIVFGLHLVATPVKYKYNYIENISTLSSQCYDSNYSKQLGLSHTIDDIYDIDFVY